MKQSLSVPVMDTLLKVFSHLLNVQTIVLTIENVELADEEGLRLLVELTKTNSRSAVVLTALLVEEKSTSPRNSKISVPSFLMKAPSMKSSFSSGGGGYGGGGGSASSSAHAMSSQACQLDAFHSTAWARQYRDVIQKSKTTTSVTLENYTNEEIDKMLAAALGVQTVPPEISQLVQDFSGGSYFWVREILQFLKEHGPELFMDAIGENEKKDPENASLSTTDAGCGNDSGAGAGAGARIRPKINKPSPTHASSSPAALKNGNASSRALTNTQSFRNPNSSRSQPARNTSNGGGTNTHSQVKLDKLVLCRFENLHADVQHVLRTASIIGTTFSIQVLYGVLPSHLKVQMSNCIKNLLAQKWLYQDTDNETLYQFAHPHAHQIIYELTPSSERKLMHQHIGEYIEEVQGEDKACYAQLSYHYQHCNTDKSLRYAVLATTVLLESIEDIFDYGNCIDLLYGSFVCCKNTFDVDVLMKLVNDARASIERFDLNYHQKKSTGIFGMLFSSCLGDTSSVAPYSSSYKDGSSNTYPDCDDEDAQTLPNDENEEAQSQYERRTKRIMLQQLERLNDQLCEKYVDFVDSNDGEEAKDWQRSLLGLSAKDGVLSMLMRTLSVGPDEPQSVHQTSQHSPRYHAAAKA